MGDSGKPIIEIIDALWEPSIMVEVAAKAKGMLTERGTASEWGESD